METSLKSKTLNSIAWSAIERFSVQIFQFLFSILLARLVTPSEFGLIAMLSIFIVIAQSFVESGFSNALIQKSNRSENDYSTVFYFNIVIAFVIYLSLFFSASKIALFYNEPLLEIICKWFGLSVIFQSFSVVQVAKLTVALDFKTQAKASFISVLFSGIIGVSLAFYGYGVWALLIQNLINSFLNTLLLWLFSKWVPTLVFSLASLKSLFSFSSKLLISGLLHTLYVNLYSLVIGRKYSSMEVGYFNQSNLISRFPSVSLMAIISRAVYPIQCNLQDENELLSYSFKSYLRMSCYIIFPIMIGLGVLSKPLILIFLTDKWLPMSKMLSILCFSYLLIPIMVVNNQILNVIGRSDYFLKAEIVKKIFGLFILFISIPFGVNYICFGIFVYNIIDILIITHFTKKVIQTNLQIQLKSILPILLLSILMGGGIYFILLFLENVYMQIIIGFLAGLFIYIFLSSIIKVKEFYFFKSLLFKFIRKI